MLDQKSVKIQIYTKEFDKELLIKHFGVYRFIYNKFLEIRRKEYIENKKLPKYNASLALVSQIEKDPSSGWLKEVNAVKNMLHQGLNILSSGLGTSWILNKNRKRRLGHWGR